MAYSVLDIDTMELLRFYRSEIGIGFGRYDIPDTQRKLLDALDWIRDGELIFLREIPELLQGNWEETLVDGTQAYHTFQSDREAAVTHAYPNNDLTEMIHLWDRQIITAEIVHTDGETVYPCDIMDWSRMCSLYPGWDLQTDEDIPRFLIPNPWNGKIYFYPIPDAAYTARITGQVEPPLLILPEDREWFISDHDLNGATLENLTTFTHKAFDRPRLMLFKASGFDADGEDVVFTGTDENGYAQTETQSFDARSDTYTDYAYLSLESIELPTVADVTASFGIGTATLGDVNNPSPDLNPERLRARSLLSPWANSWARFAGPIWAAAEFFDQAGEIKLADAKRDKFKYHLERFVRGQESFPGKPIQALEKRHYRRMTTI